MSLAYRTLVCLTQALPIVHRVLLKQSPNDGSVSAIGRVFQGVAVLDARTTIDELADDLIVSVQTGDAKWSQTVVRTHVRIRTVLEQRAHDRKVPPLDSEVERCRAVLRPLCVDRARSASEQRGHDLGVSLLRSDKQRKSHVVLLFVSVRIDAYLTQGRARRRIVQHARRQTFVRPHANTGGRMRHELRTGIDTGERRGNTRRR